MIRTKSSCFLRLQWIPENLHPLLSSGAVNFLFLFCKNCISLSKSKFGAKLTPDIKRESIGRYKNLRIYISKEPRRKVEKACVFIRRLIFATNMLTKLCAWEKISWPLHNQRKYWMQIIITKFSLHNSQWFHDWKMHILET